MSTSSIIKLTLSSEELVCLPHHGFSGVGLVRIHHGSSRLKRNWCHNCRAIWQQLPNPPKKCTPGSHRAGRTTVDPCNRLGSCRSIRRTLVQTRQRLRQASGQALVLGQCSLSSAFTPAEHNTGPCHVLQPENISRSRSLNHLPSSP